MSYTLVGGWNEDRVTGNGTIETVGHTVRREFSDDVPLDQAKTELRAICEQQEWEALPPTRRPPRTT